MRHTLKTANKTMKIELKRFAEVLSTSFLYNDEEEHNAVCIAIKSLVNDIEKYGEVARMAKEMLED